MGYRKLEVDGVTFEVSIGKTHVKFRHIGAYPIAEVGSIYEVQDKYCAGWETYQSLQVRPNDLVTFIKKNKLKPRNKASIVQK